MVSVTAAATADDDLPAAERAVVQHNRTQAIKLTRDGIVKTVLNKHPDFQTAEGPQPLTASIVGSGINK